MNIYLTPKVMLTHGPIFSSHLTLYSNMILYRQCHSDAFLYQLNVMIVVHTILIV